MTAPRAYVFDLYGTLVDYASLCDRLDGIVAEPAAFVLAWRQKQLAYAFAATLMERYLDFDEITSLALRYTASAFGATLSSPAIATLVAAWSELPPFADVRPLLERLRARGIPAGVLTNATPAALARTLAKNELTPFFAAALSVDVVRAFKPKPAVYALAVERFALEPRDIGFVSSNGWDASGAAAFGFSAIWCNRAASPAETMGRPPARTLQHLGELID